MERIRKSFRRKKNKDKDVDVDKKLDFQTIFSEAETDSPQPLTRLQKIRKSLTIRKKKKPPSIDEQQENEKISLGNDDDTELQTEETEEEPYAEAPLPIYGAPPRPFQPPEEEIINIAPPPAVEELPLAQYSVREGRRVGQGRRPGRRGGRRFNRRRNNNRRNRPTRLLA